jgi:hypothetical protein
MPRSQDFTAHVWRRNKARPHKAIGNWLGPGPEPPRLIVGESNPEKRRRARYHSGRFSNIDNVLAPFRRLQLLEDQRAVIAFVWNARW